MGIIDAPFPGIREKVCLFTVSVSEVLILSIGSRKVHEDSNEVQIFAGENRVFRVVILTDERRSQLK